MKMLDDIDLDEERTILSAPNGFKIITLYHNQKFNKQEESVWARGMFLSLSLFETVQFSLV
jgi:hypothetical protein